MARRVSEVAVFVALTLASGYALLAVPNVELMTLSVFCAGVFLGTARGGLVGALAMLVFSTFNPYGVSPFPIALAQVVMMALVGWVGGMESRWLYARIGRAGPGRPLVGLVALAVTGALLTVAYDLVTTLAMSALMAGSTSGFWALVVSGAALSTVHVASNGVIFSGIGGSAIRALTHWKGARADRA